MTCQKSLCDLCIDPGACCRLFPLNATQPHWTWEQVQEFVMTVVTSAGPDGNQSLIHSMFETPEQAANQVKLLLYGGYQHVQYGLPFVPTENLPDGQGWRFSCTRLGADGRCTNYEHRPALCRAFTAGVHSPCVMTQQALIDALANGEISLSKTAPTKQAAG